MKKLSLAAVLAFLLFSGNLFAKGSTGVGLYGNLVGSGAGAFGGGMGLTLKFGTFPVLGFEWMFANQASRLGASCDWWILNSHLTGVLDYYLGIGGFIGMGTSGDSSGLDFGGRLPIGLQIFALPQLELFGEISPQVSFLPTLGVGFALRLGLRFHF